MVQSPRAQSKQHAGCPHTSPRSRPALSPGLAFAANDGLRRIGRQQSPVKILVVSNLYPTDALPTNGIFVHEQVKALRRAGHDVRVASGKPVWLSVRLPRKTLQRLVAEFHNRRAPFRWATHDGVPVVYFNYFAGVLARPSLYPFIYRSALASRLQDLRNDFGYDIVHTHTAFLDGRAGAMAANRAGVPMILTEHTGPFSLVTAKVGYRIHTLAGLNAADRVIAVSRALRQEITSRLPSVKQAKIRVVPNGVDTAFFVPPDEGVPPAPRTDFAARDCLSSKDSRQAVRALWVGHFVEVKRVDRLIEALAIARRREPRLHLTLVGGGPLEDAIRHRTSDLGLADNVSFESHASRAVVRAAISASDFVVISSETETFGIVGIEAMSMGRPVLSTDCGGPRDYLENGTCGLLVDNSMEGLAIGLVKMAGTLDRFDANHIRDVACRRFDFSAIAAAIEATYASALATRSTS